MKSPKIRIIIVDDHKRVRASLKELLELNSTYEIIADVEDGETAISVTTELLPDVILVDINMNPMNGFMVTETIAKLLPDVKIIGFSANNEPWHAQRMLALGAKGYLTKSVSFDELCRAIDLVAAGNIYICEEVRKKME